MTEIDWIRVDYLMTQISAYHCNTILDLGCGEGAMYAKLLAEHGKNVVAVDFYDSIAGLPSSIQYRRAKHSLDIPLSDNSVEVVWASHVLEHSCNLGLFLLEIRRVLVEGGLLLVAVPPFKYEIVNHFITGWSVGQLAYVLAGFGFDCSKIRFLEEGYNVLGGGIKRELLLEPTHYGVNGVSVREVMNYFPGSIQDLLNDQLSNQIIRFNGHIRDTVTVNMLEKTVFSNKNFSMSLLAKIRALLSKIRV